MNWRHLQAFVWLRWRLMVNQYRRAGALNAILLWIVLIGAMLTAIPLFIGSFLLAQTFIPKAQPAHLLYAWDGLVAAFLFFWGIGLVTELQRSDPLALSKFLHLPVSVQSAFFINYLSSLARLTLIVFLPPMLGFGCALIAVQGLRMLVVLPLVAAFVLMVTGLTYQFQGWLASLMSNPRRRRTILTATMAAFILFFQLPNLINLYGPWNPRRLADRSNAQSEEIQQLQRTAQTEHWDAQELLKRQEDLLKQHKEAELADLRKAAAHWELMSQWANAILPVGWLPIGVKAAAEGAFLTALLGLAGMTLIGSVSLCGAYYTTIRLYQGNYTSGKGRSAPQPILAAAAAGANPPARRALLVEARLPGLSEPVAAVALGGFRALVRSPEAKMMLLTPLIMNIVFGSMLLNGRQQLPELVRPLLAIGGMAFVLLGLLQLTGNQFGFDRDGFRVFVLSAAARRDILLGKNLSFTPFVFVLAALMLALVQYLSPLRVDHFLAMFPQYVSMYLLFCLFTNLFSIYAPIYLPPGTLKPPNPKLRTALLQMVMFLVLFPLTQGISLLPLGAEAVSNFLGWTKNAPICLILSLLECVLVVLIYRLGIQWQGNLLQAREQSILETVTHRVP